MLVSIEENFKGWTYESSNGLGVRSSRNVPTSGGKTENVIEKNKFLLELQILRFYQIKHGLRNCPWRSAPLLNYTVKTGKNLK